MPKINLYRIFRFEYKKQQHGLFKVVEYSQMTDGTGFRKRTLRKNLDLSTAESIIYNLERSHKLF